MRTLDDVLGLTPLPPHIMMTTPPPSTQLQHPMLPPMMYHPALSAMGAPPPPPPPAVMVPVRPPPPPPQPPIIMPQAVMQPQPMQPPVYLPQMQVPTPSIGTAIVNVGATVGSWFSPTSTPTAIGGNIGYSMAPAGGPGGTNQLRFAEQISRMTGEQIRSMMDKAYMERAASIGGLVGSVLGGVIGTKLGPLGSLAFSFVGEKIFRGIVDNPLTRLLFSPYTAHTGEIMGGAAQMMLGTQGTLALATPGGAATGLEYSQAYQLSTRMMHQAQAWRWSTGASGAEAERYFRELSGLFTSAARSGIFATASNVDQVMDQFNKVLKFSGKLARLMGDPDIKKNIEHLGQLTTMGMTLDQAMATTERVARFARPLGISTQELFATGGMAGAQAWAAVGLAAPVGIAHGAYSQMLANRMWGSLSPMTAQMIGGQQQLGQLLTQMGAQFASGLPGQLLAMTGLTAQGGVLGISTGQMLGAQGGTFGQSAGLAAVRMAQAARQMVRAGTAENFGAAYAQIMMQQQELVSEAFQDPEQLLRQTLQTAVQLRRSGLPANVALMQIVRGNPNVARALQQAAADPNFVQRMLNVDSDRRAREAEANLQEVRERALAHEHSVERNVGIIGLMPAWRRYIARPVTEFFHERSERRTYADLLARGMIVPGIEVRPETIQMMEHYGIDIGSAETNVYERARRALRARPGRAAGMFGYEAGVLRGIGLAGQNLYAAFVGEEEAPTWLTYAAESLVGSRYQRHAKALAQTMTGYMLDLGEALQRTEPGEAVAAARKKHPNVLRWSKELYEQYKLGEKDLSPAALREFAARKLGYNLTNLTGEQSREITELSVALVGNIAGDRGKEIRASLSSKTAAVADELVKMSDEEAKELMSDTLDYTEEQLKKIGIEATAGQVQEAVQKLSKMSEAEFKDLFEGKDVGSLEQKIASMLGGEAGEAYAQLQAMRQAPVGVRRETYGRGILGSTARVIRALSPAEALAERIATSGNVFAGIGMAMSEMASGKVPKELSRPAAALVGLMTTLQMSAERAGGVTPPSREAMELAETLKALGAGAGRKTIGPGGGTKDSSELLYTASVNLNKAADKLLQKAGE